MPLRPGHRGVNSCALAPPPAQARARRMRAGVLVRSAPSRGCPRRARWRTYPGTCRRQRRSIRFGASSRVGRSNSSGVREYGGGFSTSTYGLRAISPSAGLPAQSSNKTCAFGACLGQAMKAGPWAVFRGRHRLEATPHLLEWLVDRFGQLFRRRLCGNEGKEPVEDRFRAARFCEMRDDVPAVGIVFPFATGGLVREQARDGWQAGIKAPGFPSFADEPVRPVFPTIPRRWRCHAAGPCVARAAFCKAPARPRRSWSPHPRTWMECRAQVRRQGPRSPGFALQWRSRRGDRIDKGDKEGTQLVEFGVRALTTHPIAL